MLVQGRLRRLALLPALVEGRRRRNRHLPGMATARDCPNANGGIRVHFEERRQGPSSPRQRIEVDPEEANVVRRIFAWAAEGAGLARIVRTATGGRRSRHRWETLVKGAGDRILTNERYLGRQIWGQQSVDYEPGTGRRIKREGAPAASGGLRSDLNSALFRMSRGNGSRRPEGKSVQFTPPNTTWHEGEDARSHSAHLRRFSGLAKFLRWRDEHCEWRKGQLGSHAAVPGAWRKEARPTG